jgi:nucleoside permease NupC
MSPQAQSLIGLFAIPLIAWALSERRGAIAPARLARILIAGIGLQALIAGVMLNIPAARAAFDWAAGLVAALQAATNAGMRLVFGYLAGGPAPFDTVRPETSFILAFQALPLILVISALSSCSIIGACCRRWCTASAGCCSARSASPAPSAHPRRPTSSSAWSRRRCWCGRIWRP